ncbi:MAG: secreted enzyme, sortase [Candidatus Amesbacteria bacterium GW2011_GWB1_47_19]|nr:MAG: secreted enzyme, sortase [Candidatus Amesbacteria bacterium GW2011_GWA1_44_24]KKU31925.1 MAG: sortase family protein [Candidatus Amesbacteria bacterium GW2011_GWC1_46_24]KKU66861.1 MAG: secreted enzyme, sortase [Candidatus Amesbacteria bacterium GW2011_GWB1_47_19]
MEVAAVLLVLIGGGAFLGRELKYVWIRTPLGRTVQRFEQLPPPQLVVENELGNTAIQAEQPGWKVPDDNYSLFIPEIGAISRVISAVDAGDANEYLPALQQGVAEAKGMAHPGEKGTTYLFAHSVGSRADFARYNAVFYLLHKLETGDKVEVVYGGRLFKYEVEIREILEPKNVKYLVPQSEEEKLVLATCYPPGTTWKRLVVVAKPAY